jgi:TetR/AcrR family transcriptional regulator
MKTAGLRARGERTRERILGSAERLFAIRGFAETRLEDIAVEVGIRRAAIVYYFRDKEELYTTVIDDLFGGLVIELSSVGAAIDAPDERLDAMLAAWIRYIATRPAVGRILLREIASATPGSTPTVARYTGRLSEMAAEVLGEGLDRDVFQEVDNSRFISVVIGPTVFFVTAMPALGLAKPGEMLTDEELDAHTADVLRVARRLLGTKGPRRARTRGPVRPQ